MNTITAIKLKDENIFHTLSDIALKFLFNKINKNSGKILEIIVALDFNGDKCPESSRLEITLTFHRGMTRVFDNPVPSEINRKCLRAISESSLFCSQCMSHTFR